MSSPPLPDAEPPSVGDGDLARQLTALQAEQAAIKTETAVKVSSLEDTIANEISPTALTLLENAIQHGALQRRGNSARSAASVHGAQVADRTSRLITGEKIVPSNVEAT